MRVLIAGLIAAVAVIAGAAAQAPCPQYCVCKPRASSIECAGINLTEIPVGFVGPSVLQASIIDSSLPSLPAFAFANQSIPLSSLKLTGNKITSVHDNAFQFLSSLRYLYLGKNPLQFINTSAFAPLVNLELLDLSWTYLKRFPTMPSIPIEIIEFKNSGSDGHGASMDRLSLVGVASTLQVISFVSDSIIRNHGAAPDLFANCTALSFVELRGNLPLNTPDDFFLPSVSSLNYVGVESNNITKLPSSLLAAFSYKLRSLNCKDNKLTELPEELSKARSMLSLNFVDNKVARIPLNVVRPSLMTNGSQVNFEMSGNPSSCSIDKNNNIACRCAPGYTLLNGTSCDFTCPFSELPVISNNQIQEPFRCINIDFAVPGDSCLAACHVLGPGLTTTELASCEQDGSWRHTRARSPCSSLSFGPDGEAFVVAKKTMSWAGATQFTYQFNYRNNRGQLPVINSSEYNALLCSLAPDKLIATAGVSDENTGVFFWTAAPRRGVLLYNNNSNISLSSYSNFPPGGPTSNGAVALDCVSKQWKVVDKRTHQLTIVVSFHPSNVIPPPLETVSACGNMGICSCSNSIVHCNGSEFTAFPDIPTGTTILDLSDNSLASISGSMLPSSLIRGYFQRNILTRVPVSYLPLLDITELNLNNNLIASIGKDELSNLVSRSNVNLTIDSNPLTAVSDFALTSLSPLSFVVLRNPATGLHCIYSRGQANCSCPRGLINDPRRPTYCVNADLYTTCFRAMMKAGKFVDDVMTYNSTQMSCTFPVGLPGNLTCSAVCVTGYSMPIGSYFRCRGADSINSLGNLSCIPIAPASQANPSSLSIPALSGGVVGGAVFIFAVLFVIYFVMRRRQTFRHRFTSLSARSTMEDIARALFYREHVSSVSNRKAFEMSFRQLALSRRHVKLGRELGRHDETHTVLYLATLNEVPPSGASSTGEKKEVTVRVRMSNEIEQQASVLKEAMAQHCFRHPNILALLHVSCESMPVYVVADYMRNGDLKTFLRACRPAAVRQRQTLNEVLLLGIARQCAAAMTFLESRHLIHRHLAARQFLVGHDASVVVLANLGQTRNVYVSEVYVRSRARSQSRERSDSGLNRTSTFSSTLIMETEAQQNSRWFAPECLRDEEFSHKSDVWAMGVVFYEIFSFARSPYGNLSCIEVAKEVSTGHRLEQPASCPESMYALMKRMWAATPRDRPSFAEVQGEIIMQQLPDSEGLLQSLVGARGGGLHKSWKTYTLPQLKPGKALGSRTLLVELGAHSDKIAVGERLEPSRLQSETQVWKTMRHEHIVQFLGVSWEARLLLFKHEPGGSVRELMHHRPVPPVERNKMLLGAARGLEFLHIRGVVHGRFSAHQMLMTASASIVITGFSAAGADLGRGCEPAWMCPVARKTEKFSTSADIYSFGATVFEILGYPALPPLDPSELQQGRADWGELINGLLNQCSARIPSSRPSMGTCASTMELIVYGHERWEYDPKKLVWVEELGSGAYGVVNKMAARDILRPGLTTLVAVKSLKHDAAPENEAEFLAEMQLMMKLRHPNLVNLLGVVTKTDPLMLVLEFLPGGSLIDWLRSKASQIPSEDQHYIMYQVGLGMAALHALDILHRDLAARNILVGEDLVCKVADYGLSREVTENRDYYRFRTNRPLPLRWMAPEVVRELTWTKPSDCYSFGVLAFEVVSSGATPFNQLADEALVALFSRTAPIDAVLFGNSSLKMESPLAGVVTGCLAREFATRPTFSQIAELLEPRRWDASSDT